MHNADNIFKDFFGGKDPFESFFDDDDDFFNNGFGHHQGFAHHQGFGNDPFADFGNKKKGGKKQQKHRDPFADFDMKINNMGMHHQMHHGHGGGMKMQ